MLPVSILSTQHLTLAREAGSYIKHNPTARFQVLLPSLVCLRPFYSAIPRDLALPKRPGELCPSPSSLPPSRPNDHYSCMTHTFSPSILASLPPFHMLRVPGQHLLHACVPSNPLLRFLGLHRSDSINFPSSLPLSPSPTHLVSSGPSRGRDRERERREQLAVPLVRACGIYRFNLLPLLPPLHLRQWLGPSPDILCFANY